MQKKEIINSIKIVVLALILTGVISYAWTAPGTGVIPPNDNVPRPINVSLEDQTKDGGLSLGALLVTAGSQFNGELIVTSGNPSAGKVLTAVDSTGLVKWDSPVGGGGSGSIVAVNVPYNQQTNVPVGTCLSAIRVEMQMDAFRKDGANTDALISAFYNILVNGTTQPNATLQFGSTKGGGSGHYWGYKVSGISKTFYITDVSQNYTLIGTIIPDSQNVVNITNAIYHVTCL